MMSAERIAKIKKWYAGIERRSADETVDYMGLTLDIPPDVFKPKDLSEVFGRAIIDEVKASDRVLDMGCGSGVNALLVADRCKEVVAVDISPAAVVNTQHNAEVNGMADKITVAESDLFEHVTGTFDLIMFDPPFRWFKPVDMVDRSITDDNYETMQRFFEQAADYLTDEGRILFYFGGSGDVAYFEKLTQETGFTKEVVNQATILRDGEKLNYCAYLLTAV